MKRRTLLSGVGLVAVAACTPPPAERPTSITPAPPTAVASGAIPTGTTSSMASVPATTSAPASPPGSSAPSASASAPVTAQPTLPYATASASSGAPGTGYLMTGIRLGQNDTYERVVVDLTRGSGAPAWVASYVPDFVTQGEGKTVSVPGAAKLQVIVRGLAMPSPSDPVVKGDQKLAAGVVQGAYVDPWFEGQAIVMLGLDRVRGFRVFTVDSPMRLVIDIQH